MYSTRSSNARSAAAASAPVTRSEWISSGRVASMLLHSNLLVLKLALDSIRRKWSSPFKSDRDEAKREFEQERLRFARYGIVLPDPVSESAKFRLLCNVFTEPLVQAPKERNGEEPLVPVVPPSEYALKRVPPLIYFISKGAVSFDADLVRAKAHCQALREVSGQLAKKYAVLCAKLDANGSGSEGSSGGQLSLF